MEGLRYPDDIKKKLYGKCVLVLSSAMQFDVSAQLNEDLEDLNLKVILVVVNDHSPDVKEKNVEVFKYLSYDHDNHGDIDVHATAIINILADKTERISGCFSVEENLLYLVSFICKRLNLNGLDPSTVQMLKNKFNTYQMLQTETGEFNFTTKQYIVPCINIKGQEDINSARDIAFPAILKPNSGNFSKGVTKVISRDDCVQTYREIQELLGTEWTGMGFGNSMVLMSFIEGIKYNIDLAIFEGDLVLGLLCEMGSSLPGMFIETGTCTPPDIADELRDKLIAAAFHCCLKVGIRNAVVSVEMFNTSEGIKLCEVIGRPGSHIRIATYMHTHSINLRLVYTAISCGLKPFFHHNQDQVVGIGCLLFPKYHGKQFLDPVILGKLKAIIESKEVLYFSRLWPIVLSESIFPINFGHLVAFDKDIDNARTKLVSVLTKLGLLRPDYDVVKLTDKWRKICLNSEDC